MQPMAPAADMPADEGSTGLGFLAGFFGGVIGLVLILVLAKGRKTKKGAIIGIVVQMVLAFVLGVVMAVGVFMLRAAPATTVSPPAVPASR